MRAQHKSGPRAPQGFVAGTEVDGGRGALSPRGGRGMCGLRVSSSAVQVCVLHGSVVIGRPSWVLFSETSPWGGGDRGPTPRQPGREEPWWMLRGVISLPGSLHRVLCPVTPGLSLRGSPPGCKRLQSGLLLVGVGARCGETLRTRAQGRGDAQDRGAGAGRCSGPRPRGEETLRTGAQGQGDTQDRGPGARRHSELEPRVKRLIGSEPN